MEIDGDRFWLVEHRVEDQDRILHYIYDDKSEMIDKIGHLMSGGVSYTDAECLSLSLVTVGEENKIETEPLDWKDIAQDLAKYQTE